MLHGLKCTCAAKQIYAASKIKRFTQINAFSERSQNTSDDWHCVLKSVLVSSRVSLQEVELFRGKERHDFEKMEKALAIAAALG